MDRRNFVKIAGATVAIGTTGCVGGNGEDDGGDDGEEGGDDESGDDGADDGTEEQGGIEGYLESNGANGYEGSVEDMTGQDEVTVDVGGGSGGLAFVPAAIEISPGTTVVWEWTGEGGAHNVVAEDETFDSGSAESGSDITYEYTFEEGGQEYNYYCTPHQAAGMVGGIRVAGGSGDGMEGDMDGEESMDGEEGMEDNETMDDSSGNESE